jgi:4-amino-4-deoxy-L-arabinose transferase-like glycosyltransferase
VSRIAGAKEERDEFMDGTSGFSATAVPTRNSKPSAVATPGVSPLENVSKWHRALLWAAVVTGALTHGYHLFEYPLYITDEGIYMEQAWSVLREGRLSPYTYYYDHAPAGWMMIAGWVALLPRRFETFGDAINSGRALMLVAHIASVYLLFQVTARLSQSTVAAVIATFLFNFSPLAVFYQRMVLLDNLMVFWVLLSLYLATSDKHQVLMPLLSGLTLGIGVLTKENAIFFVPSMAYLLYRNVRRWHGSRFGLSFWYFTPVAIISIYLLFATLKNELLPTNLDFDLNNPPADHVSLLYEMWFQLHRSQGSIFDPTSLVWQFSLGTWLPKDTFILAAGTLATGVNLVTGWRNRVRDPGMLVAAGLGAGYLFYLVRGSVMLQFYVVPLIPFAAINIAILGARLLDQLAGSSRFNARSAAAQAAIVATCFVALLSPFGGYFLSRDSAGKIAAHDLYKLPQTFMETEQIAYIRQKIPPDARIVMDDNLWVDLHDVAPYYSNAHSHWKAAGDPAIRDKVFAQDPQNIDYIVMSNKMLQAMQQNGHGEDYILQALSNAKQIWALQRGDVTLQIYQVQH